MSYTTNQLAMAAGVKLSTIRYYERSGLITQPERNASGYRLYTSAHIAHVRFIKNAQELGFTLDEIKELLMIQTDATSGNKQRCHSVQQRTTDKL